MGPAALRLFPSVTSSRRTGRRGPSRRPAIPDPETTKAASGCPGRPSTREIALEIRLGKAPHVFEPAIDARPWGRDAIPASRMRMATR
jgi:hypothetical protein